jgi:hypothetical protein
MGKDCDVQLQLVCELVHFKDVPAAAKWAVRCDLAVDLLPYVVQVYLEKHRSR